MHLIEFLGIKISRPDPVILKFHCSLIKRMILCQKKILSFTWYFVKKINAKHFCKNLKKKDHSLIHKPGLIYIGYVSPFSSLTGDITWIIITYLYLKYWTFIWNLNVAWKIINSIFLSYFLAFRLCNNRVKIEKKAVSMIYPIKSISQQRLSAVNNDIQI